MAMTKKEKEAHDALVREIRTLGALRWTTKVKPDVAPPTPDMPSGTLTTGWTHNAFSMTVTEGCSGHCSHSDYETTRTTSQRAKWLHSSKLRALRSMRYEMEREFAKKLAQVDEWIEMLDSPNQA